MNISGLKLSNPIMNASGVLASTPEGVVRLIFSGVSAIVTKTLTVNPRENYGTPIIVPLPYGLINAVGLANPGIKASYELVRAGHKMGKPVIVSIGGRNDKEFQYLAEVALDAGADAIELNLSCPHTEGYGLDAASSKEVIRKIVSAVSSISSKPVWAKLGFSPSIVELCEAVLESGARVLVLINTIPAMKIDVFVKKPVLSHGYGGLSGPAIHPIAVYSVYKVYEELQCEIIGCGGVTSWIDVIEFLLAGARGVQMATAFYMKGYDVVGEIISGIEEYLVKMGYNDISEIIGLAHS